MIMINNLIKIICYLMIIIPSLTLASIPAVCNCPETSQVIDLDKYYARLYAAGDVIFVGRIIDTLQINPTDYVAVFEEIRLLKGPQSKIKYAMYGKKTKISLRYVLVSEIENMCLTSFKNFYDAYIVVANNKSSSGTLLAASICNGSGKFDRLFYDSLKKLSLQDKANQSHDKNPSELPLSEVTDQTHNSKLLNEKNNSTPLQTGNLDQP